MDRVINSKVNKHFIYEIYRACRLCGAGAGYKMPIIQNVIDVDGEEVELKKKIRECVQIEVKQDDKMPPLICELCVDKVNDFYEFLEMCRQTNIRTRKRLGLPMQATQKGSNDDCILGVTEPVYVNEEDEPLSKSSSRNAKQKASKFKRVEVKVENIKSTRQPPKRQRSPSPPTPRTTRHSKSSNDDDLSLSRLKNQSQQSQHRSSRFRPSPVSSPKSILKKETKVEEKASPRTKRTLEPPKPAVPQKKVKLSVQPPPKVAAKTPAKTPPKPAPKPAPKPIPKPAPKTAPKPAPTIRCNICRFQSKTPAANANHLRSHGVSFTLQKLACNACREWFSNLDDAIAHHRRHKVRRRPYQCRGCDEKYESYHSYQTHVNKTDCVPWEEVPDVECPECWRKFPTDNLREAHKCPGPDARPGGKCSKCSRPYALLKNLKKHESTCTVKRRAERYIDPALLEKCRPIQIRFARCDPLLLRTVNGHYDVSDVQDYGLDSTRVYPYIHSASLNFNRMVNIKAELDFYCEENYIHWDSEISDDEDEEKEKENRVLPLSTLAIKTLFSQKCLGRVPKKKRKIKPEKSLFDSILNTDFDMSKDIDSLIDNLGDDDNVDGDQKDSKVDESTEKDANTSNEIDESADNITDKDLSLEKESGSADTKKLDSVTEKDSSVDTEKLGASETDKLLESEKTDVSEKENSEETNKGVSEKDNSGETEKSEDVSDKVSTVESEKQEGASEKNDKMDCESKKIEDASEKDDKMDCEKTDTSDKTNSEEAEKSETNESHETIDKVGENNENHEKSDSPDKNLPENVEEGTKDAKECNDIEKIKEIINEKKEFDNDVVMKESTNTEGVKTKIEEKDSSHTDVNDESNKVVTAENSASDLSVKTDSVSESIEDKNTDSLSENQNQTIIDSNNTNIHEKNETVQTNADENKDVVDNVEENDTCLDLSSKVKDNKSDADKQLTENTKEDSSNTIDNKEESSNSIENSNNGKQSDSEKVVNKQVNLNNEQHKENQEIDVSTNDVKNNDANKAVNGAEEKSDNYSDTEIDDKKLMDALNEHIGETNEKIETSDAKRENKDDKRVDSDGKGGVTEKIEEEKITLDDLIPKKDSDTHSMDLDSISDEEFNFDS